MSIVKLDRPDFLSTYPIAEAFQRCSRQFKELFLSLTHSDCRVTHQVPLSRIRDENGRLGVWGGNAGADRTGRGSLDDRLRNDPELQSIVLDLLESLRNELERGTSIARAGSSNSLAASAELQVVYPDTLSSTSSDTENSSDEGRVRRPQKSDLQRSVTLAFDLIRSLYKTSVLLRRPAIQDKYIRSISKDENVSHFIFWDKLHISEKLGQWALNRGQRYQEPVSTESSLVTRLAVANTRRREQLKYWLRHPDRLIRVNDETAIFPQQHPGQPPTPENEPQSQTKLNETGFITDPSPNTAVPSSATKQSFSTVAISEPNDDATLSGRPKTIYESSTGHEGGQSLRIPDVPSLPPGILLFDCPLCFSVLDIQEMQHRRLWKKHIFRDLRPYVCTFEHCMTGEKLYVTRHDWLYHEMQIHRRRWVCAGDCRAAFKTKVLMEQHMRKEHRGAFSELQLPTLLEICERPADLDEVTECPLCPDRLKLELLQSHLAKHLEDLAMFVLPVEANEQSQGGGSNIVEARDDKVLQHEMDGLSSLGTFSDTEADRKPIVDDPKKFANLLSHVNVQDPLQGWLKENRQPDSSKTNAERFDDEKRRLIESLFAKKDENGSTLETYITHTRVIEDASSPASPPPVDSSSDNKKDRVIIVAVRQSGRVRVHKGRENPSRTFSIGKTWNLDELGSIKIYQEPVLDAGFLVWLTKPYYWQARSKKEKEFFISSLIKIYEKYTGGKLPELVGFTPEEEVKYTSFRKNR